MKDSDTEQTDNLHLKTACNAPEAFVAAPGSGEGVKVRYETEGLTKDWRIIGAHLTYEAAKADMHDYAEWSSSAVAAWKGFRIVKITETREVLPNGSSSATARTKNALD